MCGIVGFTGSQNAAPILLDGLKKLEYRGYDSAGMAVLGQDGIQMVKTIGMIKNLDNKTQGGAALPGTAGIGHTRWATHGEPTDVNAHPHMSNDDKFAIVHNGIIENYAQLREELKAKGFQFKSETDTEVIVHLLDLYYEGDLKKAVLKTVSRLEGAYALGILCAEEGGRLIATRHAAPLIVGVGIGENYFASDVTALVAYTKNVIYLEDGEIADITPDRITVYDSIGKNLEKSITRIAWDIAAAEKGGYDHFMLKEIMEQPNAIKSTIEPPFLSVDGDIRIAAQRRVHSELLHHPITQIILHVSVILNNVVQIQLIQSLILDAILIMVKFQFKTVPIVAIVFDLGQGGISFGADSHIPDCLAVDGHIAHDVFLILAVLQKTFPVIHGNLNGVDLVGTEETGLIFFFHPSPFATGSHSGKKDQNTSQNRQDYQKCNAINVLVG